VGDTGTVQYTKITKAKGALLWQVQKPVALLLPKPTKQNTVRIFTQESVPRVAVMVALAGFSQTASWPDVLV
jgi:hypothetical protein